MRSKPDASIVQAARAVDDGRADALVSAGSTGPTLAAATLAVQAPARGAPPGPRRAAADPRRPRAAARRRRERGGPPRAPRPVRLHGRVLHGGRLRPGAPARGPAVRRRGVRARAPPPCSPRASGIEEAGGLNFVGNVEGFDLPGAGADVVVTDGFTGNVALKVLEGTSRLVREAISRRRALEPRVGRRRPADPRPRRRAARASSTPRRVGGAILLGLRKPVVVAHGSFGPRGIASAVRPRAARRGRGHGRAHRGRARGRRRIAVRARW